MSFLEFYFHLFIFISLFFKFSFKILKQRKSLDRFLSSESKYWQYLCSEIGENAESEFLNGHEYKIHVTDYLPEKHLKELKNVSM